jgi:hypothetical protein
MLSFKLEHLLAPRVHKLRVVRSSVMIDFVVQSVGHGVESEHLRIILPYNPGRELNEHARYAWSRAVAGRYPSPAGTLDCLKRLATYGGQGVRVQFAPFTPQHLRGPPPMLDWSMFSRSIDVDGARVAGVCDDHFDWSFDCEALTGTVPVECLPLDELSLDDIEGTLDGNRVIHGSVSAISIRSLDARVVWGYVSNATLSPGIVMGGCIADVQARKLKPPVNGEPPNVPFDVCSGSVSVKALPPHSLRLGQGLDLSLATGMVDPASLAPDCITIEMLAGVGAASLIGRVPGGLLGDRSVPPDVFFGHIDADKVIGAIKVADGQVNCSHARFFSANVNERMDVSSNLCIHGGVQTHDLAGRSAFAIEIVTKSKTVCLSTTTCRAVEVCGDTLAGLVTCQALHTLALNAHGRCAVPSLTVDELRSKTLRVEGVLRTERAMKLGSFASTTVVAAELRAGVVGSASHIQARELQCSRLGVQGLQSHEATVAGSLQIAGEARVFDVVCGGPLASVDKLVASSLGCQLTKCGGCLRIPTLVCYDCHVHLNVSTKGSATCKGHLKGLIANAVDASARKCHARTLASDSVSVRGGFKARSLEVARSLSCATEAAVHRGLECKELRTCPVMGGSANVTGQAISHDLETVSRISSGAMICNSVKTSLCRANESASTHTLQCRSLGVEEYVSTRVNARVDMLSTGACASESLVATGLCQAEHATTERMHVNTLRCGVLVTNSGLASFSRRFTNLSIALNSIGA